MNCCNNIKILVTTNITTVTLTVNIATVTAVVTTAPFTKPFTVTTTLSYYPSTVNTSTSATATTITFPNTTADKVTAYNNYYCTPTVLLCNY